MNLNETYIPHSKPTLGTEEQAAVTRVLASGQIAQGPEVEKFEQEFAAHFGFANAVATNSGTAALHLALIGMGVGGGDEVIVPVYVCTALLNAVHFVGAKPVLADVDPRSGNLDVESAKALVNPDTRAIIVPHMFGLPVDLKPLSGLGVPIIEDCAQSIGAVSRQSPVGVTGEVSIFSFFATKMLATGEGGMLVCRSTDVADRLRDLRSYDERPDYRTRFNYKLTDVLAALGRCQLARLDSMISRRRAIASFYNDSLHDTGLLLPPESSDRIYFRYTIGVENRLSDWLSQMQGYGIGCARPVHRLLSSHLGQEDSLFPGGSLAFKHLMSIPIYPSLTDADMERVVLSLKKTRRSMQ